MNKFNMFITAVCVLFLIKLTTVLTLTQAGYVVNMLFNLNVLIMKERVQLFCNKTTYKIQAKFHE